MVAVLTCPACHGSGYEAVAEDEVAPCTHPDHDDPVNAYGIRRSEWLRMAARDLVEADGYRWRDRDANPHYRGLES